MIIRLTNEISKRFCRLEVSVLEFASVIIHLITLTWKGTRKIQTPAHHAASKLILHIPYLQTPEKVEADKKEDN